MAKKARTRSARREESSPLGAPPNIDASYESIALDDENPTVIFPDELPTEFTSIIDELQEAKRSARQRAEESVAVDTASRSPTAIFAEDVKTDADPSIAKVIQQLERKLALAESEIAVLKDKTKSVDEGESGYPFMYYKRPDDGGPMANWIVIGGGGVGPTSGGRDVGTYSTLIGKGFKPLTRYGVLPPMVNFRGRPGSEFCELIRKGGAKLVPASQVLALRWHLNPPIAGTVFDQYEKVKDQAVNFFCDEGGCNTEFWFLPDDQTTAGACLEHLRKRHEYKFDDARATLVKMGIPYRTSRVRAVTEEVRIDQRARRAELESEEEE